MSTEFICSTTVPKGLKPEQGLLRVSLEVIDEHGGTTGQHTMVVCDWSEDDWQDAARAGLQECIRKTDDEILRNADFGDDDIITLTEKGRKFLEDQEKERP